jgi:hypothetical protein
MPPKKELNDLVDLHLISEECSVVAKHTKPWKGLSEEFNQPRENQSLPYPLATVQQERGVRKEAGFGAGLHPLRNEDPKVQVRLTILADRQGNLGAEAPRSARDRTEILTDSGDDATGSFHSSGEGGEFCLGGASGIDEDDAGSGTFHLLLEESMGLLLARLVDRHAVFEGGAGLFVALGGEHEESE